MEFRKIAGNEFSRLLPREQLDHLPFNAEISASGEERTALAQRFDLLDLAGFSTRISVSEGVEPGQILIKGVLDAEVTQACVVTLDPLESHLKEPFEVEVVDPAVLEKRAAKKATKKIEPGDDDEEEPPELLPPEGLDLGEIAAQQLAVTLDPYPRIANADDALREIIGVQDEETKPGPFEVLRGLQRKD